VPGIIGRPYETGLSVLFAFSSGSEVQIYDKQCNWLTSQAFVSHTPFIFSQRVPVTGVIARPTVRTTVVCLLNSFQQVSHCWLQHSGYWNRCTVERNSAVIFAHQVTSHFILQIQLRCDVKRIKNWSLDVNYQKWSTNVQISGTCNATLLCVINFNTVTCPGSYLHSHLFPKIFFETLHPLIILRSSSSQA
jgi:hypothetical protein